MAGFELAVVDDRDAAAHRYVVLECHADDRAELIAALAELVLELYVDPTELADQLRTAAIGLGEVADMGVIEAVIAEISSATIPDDPPEGQPEQLQLQRNELAEILAYVAAEQYFGTLVPAKRVRHKEVPRLPSRGMDMLGLDIEPEIALILSEAKASEEHASPPAVVGSGSSSLRAQLRAFQGDVAKILVELRWAERHSPPAEKEHVARAMLRLAHNDLPMVVFPVLLRTAGAHQLTDPGCFADEPQLFFPARVRFCTIRVDEPLAPLAREVYAAARHARAS
jgi:hypothetical protein